MPHPEVPEPGPGEGRPSDETPLPRRSEIRLIERAVRQRWPIPDSVRFGTVKALVRVIEEAQPDEDDVPAAPIDGDGPEADDDDDDRPRFVPPPPKADARSIVAATRCLIAMDRLNAEQERFDAQRADDRDDTEARAADATEAAIREAVRGADAGPE